MAVVSYLISPVESPPQYGLDHEFSIGDDQFLPTMAGATGEPFWPGNTLAILNNGDAFYPAMLEAIAAAEVSITIEAYIYWAGDIGRQFADALAARAKCGVPVKILLDAVGSSTIGEDILRILERGQCQLAWYNPISLRRLGRFNHRTHRKSLIVDGRVAFTGGAGIADHWRGNARHPGEWRDQAEENGVDDVAVFEHDSRRTGCAQRRVDFRSATIRSRVADRSRCRRSRARRSRRLDHALIPLSIICARRSSPPILPYRTRRHGSA
jgi:hypothetical protein